VCSASAQNSFLNNKVQYKQSTNDEPPSQPVWYELQNQINVSGFSENRMCSDHAPKLILGLNQPLI